MANTPFLDLVKPAGTDRALVSVINSNSDKIDTGVSTLSEQIANKANYLDLVRTADTQNTPLAVIQAKYGDITAGDYTGIIYTSGNRWQYHGYKYNANNGVFICSSYGNSTIVIVRISGGTWLSEELATHSETYLLTGGTAIPENANIDTYTTPGKYGTNSSTIARTMSGLPFAQGSQSNFAFNLIVENSALNDSSARRQVLQFFNDSAQWVRYGTTSSWTTGWVRNESPKITTGSVTTDSNGRFNVSSIIGVGKTCLGITNVGAGWYHFRWYSGSDGATMCIVTDYNTDTEKPGVTISYRIVHI